MHRNVDQDESNLGREIDCWNSNRIYRRSQALFTSAVYSGVDLAQYYTSYLEDTLPVNCGYYALYA